MLKQFCYGMLILSLFLFSSAVMAQGMRPGKWWKDPNVVQKLQLTDSQIAQLDAAYNNSRLKMIQQKSDVERKRFELQNLFEKKSFNEKAIQKQHRKVEKARNRLGEERLKFIMEVRKIIGSEKYSQLKLIFSDSFRERSWHRNEDEKSKPKKR